ncbi:MAG TPA: hypothetical protein VHE37_00835, partial [Nevskiaceae bacterium]|nr:hypothetical protein [Nevskiaceae bacterium]
ARAIFGSRVAWDFNLRDYYISGIASTETGGSENIARADTSITWRIWGLHGVTLKYALSQREAQYPDNPAQRQRVGTVSIAYTLLGSTRFGAVDWRPSAMYKPPDKM